MPNLLEMVEKHAENLLINFEEDFIIEFLDVFEKTGFDILTKKISENYNHHCYSFCKYISHHVRYNKLTEEVKNSIFSFLIEKSKEEKPSIRFMAVEALLDSGYENKSYFEELFTSEQNKMIKALLEAHFYSLSSKKI